jgi:scyllo-inositol 2-dehydrogenase (NADP+)
VSGPTTEAAPDSPLAPLRLGLVGIGKMGVSHLAIAGAHDGIEVAGVCDSQAFLLAGLRSQLDLPTFKSFESLLDSVSLDVVLIATSTPSHFDLATAALDRGISVFVEKPLTLSARQSRALADQAQAVGVANQVGYHNRFIATFQEAARLVASGAIGTVHHVDGRAYGPVVTRAEGGSFTWRSRRSEGGGCLHDYASHVVDLMNFVVGPPTEVVGATLSSVHSRDVEDVVNAVFSYPDGATGSLETNWSDPSHRKMSTTITVHGTGGKIVADRQELRVHLGEGAEVPGYQPGWNVRYITELQPPVWFYLRGEEYSAQIDHLVDDVRNRNPSGPSSFSTAADADWVIEQIAAAHAAPRSHPVERAEVPVGSQKSRWSAWLRQAPVPGAVKRAMASLASLLDAVRRRVTR